MSPRPVLWCTGDRNLSLRPVPWCTVEGTLSLRCVLWCTGEENLSLRRVRWCTGVGNLSLCLVRWSIGEENASLRPLLWCTEEDLWVRRTITQNMSKNVSSGGWEQVLQVAYRGSKSVKNGPKMPFFLGSLGA